MMASITMLTHADVVIDPSVPVPDWPLSERGRARHDRLSKSGALSNIRHLWCSSEHKARDAAEITGKALGLEARVLDDLCENDRSATGFLPKDEFEATADAFFENPDVSIRGWETARAAQTRIVGAISRIAAQLTGDALVIGHGGTATLLRCHLLGLPITRKEDQPPVGGGCLYRFNANMQSAPSDWSII